MGYGPVDNNRFGWCWRNEHGTGKRMTPYFKTEELANIFHDYLQENNHQLTDTTPKEVKNAMRMLDMMNSIPVAGETETKSFNYFERFDLRKTKLLEVNDLAKIFAKENKIKVICEPKAETLREFYGVDQEDTVGYCDPRPFSWEE